jgi:hypothetical protein
MRYQLGPQISLGQLLFKASERQSNHVGGSDGDPQDPRASDPAVADRDHLCDHQPPLRPGQPRPTRRLPPGALGDRETACTTSATPPSPRTTPRSAPAPPPTPWRPCATWSSGCRVVPGRSTSPPRYAATPTTSTGPRDPGNQPRMNPTSPHNDGALAQGVRCKTAWPCSRSAGTDTWSCTTSQTPSIRRKHAVQRTHRSVS